MPTAPVPRFCFTSPEVYVLVNAKAAVEPRLFHWLATDRIDEEDVVRCFLSLSDAMIFCALLRTSETMAFAPAKASQFGIEAFRVGDRYLANLNIGWAANGGRLLVSKDGVFATLAMPLSQSFNSPATNFEVDNQTLALVAKLYEHAGIFMWREMLAKQECGEAELRNALDGREIAQLSSVEQDEHAFFNSDSGKWHFSKLDHTC